MGLQLEKEARKIRGEIRELRGEARATSSTRVALRMSSCKLSRRKTNILETLWQNCTTPLNDLHWRGTVVEGVCEPAWLRHAAMETLSGGMREQSDKVLLPCVRTVCKRRETRVVLQCFVQSGRRGQKVCGFFRFAESSGGWLRADREA